MKKLLMTFAAVLTLVAAMLPAVLVKGAEGPLDTVVISPAPALVAVNGTQQFTAVSQDAANQTVGNATYVWSVAAGGGTINATSGLFTAGNDTGTFNSTVAVVAVQGNITVSAVATVTVAVPGQLVTLAVSPAAITLPVNGTQQFTAVAKDAFNQNATGVNLTWSVVADGGTINSTSGLFTAGNATGTFNGTVQVTAVQGDIARTANATVAVVAKSVKKPGTPPGWEHGKKKGWDDKHTPPGWDHGKKKGWDDKHSPPGLAREQDDDQDENEAEHAKPGRHAQPENPAKEKGNNGNAGNTPAAGIANAQGKGKD